MKNKYEQIKEEQGEAAAKAYMREIRARVKKPSGVAALPKERQAEIMAHARAAKGKGENRDTPPANPA